MRKQPHILEALYAIFLLPTIIAWPVLWALSRWEALEVTAWVIGVVIGVVCCVRWRDWERRPRERD